MSRNEPAELPRIADTLAELRGWTADATREQGLANALQAFPRLQALLIPGSGASKVAA
jgi:TatD DNase family protein